jgi:hypothetical protein
MAHDEFVIGKGERIVDLRFVRVKGGLKVTVQAHPMVEDIFKSWSIDGRTIPAQQHGRLWRPVEEGDSLEVYNLPPGRIPVTPLDRTSSYRVDRIGTLIIEGGEPLHRPSEGRLDVSGQVDAMTVNIGYLRLKDISRSGGKSFILAGVFSTEGVKEMSEKSMAAIRRLFMDYMRPIDLSITISAKEGTL